MTRWNLGGRLALPTISGAVGVTGALDLGTDLIRAPAAGVARTAFIIGDSITEHNYGATPIYNQNGMMGAKSLQIIHNAGHSGQSISGLVSQIELDWEDVAGGGAMGLIGMPSVGWGFLRIGTNNARGAFNSVGVAIDAGMQADYVSIINRMLDFAEHVVLLPVPPIGGFSLTKNTAVPSYNAYLRSLVLADATGRLHWVDDCSDLIDGSGNIIDGYFNPGDELHPYPPGQWQMALTAEAQLTALLANQTYTSDLVSSSSDVYPAQPQWVDNPTNVGTGGTVGTGLTGSAPNSTTAFCGPGSAAGTVAIVAAAGGDPNTVPWVRLTPSTVSASGYFGLEYTGSGRTVTSTDPLDLEQMVEVRFNGIDPTYVDEAQIEMRVGAYELPKRARLQFGGWGSTISRTMVLRQKIHRKDSNADNGTRVCKLQILTSANFTGSVGSVDFRCFSIRG